MLFRRWCSLLSTPPSDFSLAVAQSVSCRGFFFCCCSVLFLPLWFNSLQLWSGRTFSTRVVWDGIVCLGAISTCVCRITGNDRSKTKLQMQELFSRSVFLCECFFVSAVARMSYSRVLVVDRNMSGRRKELEVMKKNNRARGGGREGKRENW